MDAKDKRIAELEALLKAALERIAILEARIAVLEKIRPIPPSRPPPISSSRPSNRRTSKKRNENAEPKRATSDVFENPSKNNKSTRSSSSISTPVRPAAEFLLQQTSRPKSISKSNSSRSHSSLRNFVKIGIGANIVNVSTPRGSIVPENILGLDYAGTISCDFWGAYRKFDRLTSVALQFCWAHPIREVKFLAESKDAAVARYGRRLLKQIRGMFSTIHRRDRWTDATWLRKMRAHRDAILKTAWGTIPQSSPGGKDAINLAERLGNWRDEYFRFIESDIPATNNLGEQTIRKVVIDRKVTQGTRSDWGNRWLERFWSVLSTCEQQGTNVMSFLNSCIESFLHGLAPPSLLRD